MYKKPMTKEDHEKWLELMGDPTEEDFAEIQEAVKKDEQKALDLAYCAHLIEQEDKDADSAIAAIKRAKTGLKSRM